MKQQNFEDENSSVFKPDVLMSRKIALEILNNVLNRKQSLDNTLDDSKCFQELPSRERGFVRMMVTTCIRRLGQVDDLITRSQDRPESNKSAIITNILRLGVTQMFFMVVPDHASVDTSVELAVVTGNERQKDFVNAVLRRLTREGSKIIKFQDAVRLNTPEWLLKIWITDYGLKTAAEIASANLHEAPLDITVKKQEENKFLGSVLKATELSTGSLRRMIGGNVKELDGYDEGSWWVQDASAALAVQILDPREGESIFDMCAAPGGKTMQMAAAGAYVVAVDRSANRMKRLQENLARVKLRDKVEIEIVDASVWKPKRGVSKILLDAPCSATGTIRRHPDIPYLKTINDIENLILIQKRLLNHSASILESGGVLVYCTCSLQKDEGERQIEQFLSSHSEFRRMPIHLDEIGGHDEFINSDGDVRILPTFLSEHGGMDGFFISRMRKQ